MRKQELHPRTAVINKKQKNQAKIARNKALNWLVAKFPAAFDTTLRIRPLKLGIMDDILSYAEDAAAVGISRSKLRQAIVIFTRRIDYLTCLKAREMRVDLQGNPLEEVTEDEAMRAAAKIKKRVEKTIKNARKNVERTPNHSHLPAAKDMTVREQPMPYYAEHPQVFSGQYTPPARPAPVIKHKSTRAYDPDAVARLKEKLGLSRKQEISQEETS